MIELSVGSLLIANATIRNELMAEPADGLTYAAIIMLPEYLEQAVDPEVIGNRLERLVEGGSLERWGGLDGGNDP
jgi:hypothetical protein